MIPLLLPKDSWKRSRDALLGLVYPNCCQICAEEPATSADGYVGAICRRSLRPIGEARCLRCGLPFAGDIHHEFTCANCAGLDLAFDSARAAVVASGVVLEVIHRFKYQRARWFEPFLVNLLLQAALPELRGAGWTAVVPVPLHPVKEREREFNQADCLALPLARALGIPVRRRLVQRVAPTQTQTHLSRNQRSGNVRRAFRRTSDDRLDGESLIVVDDVLTTGATTSAVAGVLRRLGASRVCVWSVARAVLGEPPTQ